MALLPIQRNPDRAQPDALAEMKRLRHELTRLLDTWPAFTTFVGDSFSPVAKVADLDDAYVVELKLANVKAHTVEVSITGRRLTVTGTGRDPKRWWFHRRRSTRNDRFFYEVVLPGAVEEEQVMATLDRAMLTVRAPKPVTGRRRRIQIQ